MLRIIFVIAIIIVLGANALRGPFEALLFYLWIAYFRPDAWLWDQTAVTTLRLSFGAGVYLLLRSLPRLGRAPFDLRGLLLLLFLLLTGVSAWTSEANAAWALWPDFGKTIALSYVLYVLASESFDKLRLVMITISFSLGFEAVKQGYFGLVFGSGDTNTNTLPQLGDNNGVAVGMLMLAMLFVALVRTSKGKWEQRLYVFFIIGVLYRAITTYSRGAFIALAALTVVYVARSDQKLKATIGALVIGSILLPALPQRFWDRMNTVTVSENKMDDSSAGRIHFWRVAVLMASDHPWLGVGYNTYDRAFDRYDFSAGYYGTSRSVHSMWFGVLGELGYPALLIYLSIFALAFLGMSKVMALARAGRVPMDYYHVAVALQAAFVACAIGGSFLPWQYTEMLWHFIAMTMALRHVALKHANAKVVDAPSHVFQSPLMRTA